MNVKIKLLLLSVIVIAATLRFYELGKNPPSLYWDEVSLGYNAYAILKSGVDEHGKFLPITNFAAFGDYKPPIYIYLTVPSIAIFGVNEFAIRFPSAFFGTITVLLCYFLAKKIFRKDKIALIATFFLAISPWHVQFSRAAFEANLGLFFSTLGVLFFIKFASDNSKYIYVSALSFLAALYTFTGQRLFVPLILLVLIWTFRSDIKKNLVTVLVTAVASAIIFYPLFNFSTKTIEGRLRFEEVTIFKDLDPINESAGFIGTDNNSVISKVIHNRRLFFAREFMSNYFDAFDPGFLFAHGDGNPRLSIQDTGELYYFELPLILTGAYFLVKNNDKYKLLIFSWLLISPLGPATARETPHALRMVHIIPTFQMISAYGFVSFAQKTRYRKLLSLLFTFAIFISIFYYLHQYYFHYNKKYSGEWQYGYKEAVMVAKENYDKVDKIVVTQKLGRPYIYFLFYNQITPQQYLKSADIVKDDFFFYHVNGFDKYIFSDDFDKYKNDARVLFITPHDQLPVGVNKLKTIYDMGDFAVFDVGVK